MHGKVGSRILNYSLCLSLDFLKLSLKKSLNGLIKSSKRPLNILKNLISLPLNISSLVNYIFIPCNGTGFSTIVMEIIMILIPMLIKSVLSMLRMVLVNPISLKSSVLHSLVKAFQVVRIQNTRLV